MPAMTHLINPPPVLLPPKMPLHLSNFLPLLFLVLLHLWLHYRQPLPYMDELFHIPQAQAFCRSLRVKTLPAYDPAITTLPGLYLPPAALHFFTSGRIPCSPRVLRITSLLAAALALPLLSSLLTALRARARRPARPDPSHAVAIWLHPVALFYAQLFYTDPLALLALLLAHLYALRAAHLRAASFAFFAALTRQTNIVWHFYLAADAAIPLLVSRCTQNKPLYTSVRILLPLLWPHALTACVYLTFLVLNAGPALGDKAHHAPTAHWAMLPYFLGFHAASYLPFQLLEPRELVAQATILRRSPALRAGALSVCAVLAAMIVATGDHVHPFTLADNRHFVFYVYRKWLLRAPWRKLALLPLYVWGAIGPVLELEMRRRGDGGVEGQVRDEGEAMRTFYVGEYVSDALLVLCAAASLVPSPLLEPRYFVVASTLWSMRRMARRAADFPAWGMCGVAAALAVVNVGLVYVFAEMPFERPVDAHMPNDSSPGRFMF